MSRMVRESGDSNVILLFVPTKEESAFRELGSSFGFAACAACGAFMVTINMDASVRPPKCQRKSCFRVFVCLPFPNDSIPKQSPVHHLG